MTSATSTKPIANLVAIASGKGGVGKTWLSINVAMALGQLGQKVLLIDGDMGLANVDIQLGLVPHHDWLSVLSKPQLLDEAIIHHPDGPIDILAGRSGSGQGLSLAHQRLSLMQQILTQLSTRYDVMILDLGAGIDDVVRGLCNLAEKIVVVLTEEPTALTDAYALIKMTRRDNSLPHGIVVNQATSRSDGELVFQKLVKATHHFLQYEPPLLGVLSHDAKVTDSIRKQTSFYLRSPATTLGREIEMLARKLK